jgi:hypothetical protein
MKQLKAILAASMTLLVMVCFVSCLDDNDDNANSVNYPNALVTLKSTSNGLFYMQLDDSTVLIPTNYNSSPYQNKELRALVNYTISNKESQSQSGHYAKSVYVNWIDTIRTKDMAPNLGDKNATVYGTAPLEIVNDWTTIVEDGYLTLRFRTYFGGQAAHTLNLVKTSNPYEVELYHNANGDTSQGVVRDGIIAFRLDQLPDTEGKTVDLTVKWKSFSGDKSVKFKYCTRKNNTLPFSF